jgi:hypothetical protein
VRGLALEYGLATSDMVWLSWRKYKALVKDCWPSDFADAAVNVRNVDKLIIYSQAAPNKLPEISGCGKSAAAPLALPHVPAGTSATACRNIASGGGLRT